MSEKWYEKEITGEDVKTFFSKFKPKPKVNPKSPWRQNNVLDISKTNELCQQIIDKVEKEKELKEFDEHMKARAKAKEDKVAARTQEIQNRIARRDQEIRNRRRDYEERIAQRDEEIRRRIASRDADIAKRLGLYNDTYNRYSGRSRIDELLEQMGKEEKGLMILAFQNSSLGYYLLGL